MEPLWRGSLVIVLIERAELGHDFFVGFFGLHFAEGFGGAIFQTMRRFFGTDNIPFTIVSDEFNGVTKDNSGNVRPFIPRSYNTFSQAEEENGQSRIYLGIHWSFDKTAAIAEGRAVANYVFDHSFRPVSKK